MAYNGICIKEGGTTNAPSMRHRSLPLSFNAMLAVCVGLMQLPVSFSSFLFFVGGEIIQSFIVNNFFKIVLVYTKLYRIFVI